MSEEKIDAYTYYASTDYVDENSVQSDLFINDENDPAYVKNRDGVGYVSGSGIKTILEETTIDVDEYGTNIPYFEIVEGKNLLCYT